MTNKSGFIPGSGPTVRGLVTAFAVQLFLGTPTAIILNKILVDCNVEPVLYSYFAWGLITFACVVLATGMNKNRDTFQFLLGVGWGAVVTLWFPALVMLWIGNLHLIPTCY